MAHLSMSHETVEQHAHFPTQHPQSYYWLKIGTATSINRGVVGQDRTVNELIAGLPDWMSLKINLCFKENNLNLF